MYNHLLLAPVVERCMKVSVAHSTQHDLLTLPQMETRMLACSCIWHLLWYELMIYLNPHTDGALVCISSVYDTHY